jgi:hypothetical protein
MSRPRAPRSTCNGKSPLELEVEKKERQLLTTPDKRKICQFRIRPVCIFYVFVG